METKDDWKERAAALFFFEKKSIREIAEILRHDRKTVRTALKAHDDFLREKEIRKQQTKERNKEYKADWDRKNRKKPETGSLGEHESRLLTNQHNTDVRVLSHERIDGARW